jgi:hypothetical protein
MTEEPYWKSQEYLDRNEKVDALIEELRIDLVNKAAAIRLATSVGLDEAGVEFHVDSLWNGLRELALDPERVDEVIGLLINYVNHDASYEVCTTLGFLEMEES